MKESRWWVWSAGLVAVLMVALAVGNLIDDDGGPIYGRIIFAAVLIGGAALIAAGTRIRITKPVKGARLIAVGVLPAISGLTIFWFPPVMIVGALALATAVSALRETKAMSSRAALLSVGAAALLMIPLIVGLA